MNDSETMSLYSLSQLPLDRDAEIFRQYPGFKLGVTASVRYYAELLLPIVKKLLASDSAHNDWIFTAPPIVAQTPAGANLLCRELFDLYVRERLCLKSHRARSSLCLCASVVNKFLSKTNHRGTEAQRNQLANRLLGQSLRERARSDSKELSVIDLHYDNETTVSRDYAKLDFADRVTERERLSRRLVHNADFHGRPILFVNDICVTGAQQHAMQQYFESAGAACVRWLYLIVVDPEIGKMKPRIEWEINFAPFEDLLRMVSREQIQFTGKCVQRLMTLSVAELDRVLRALDEERRTRLLELAILNGFQDLDGFRDQMELIRSYCLVESA